MKAYIAAAFLGVGVLSSSAFGASCAGLTDVEDTSPFCASVAWMKNRDITTGCAPSLYCPSDPVSRLAMAAFMSRLDRVLPPTLVDSSGRALGTYHRFSEHVVYRRIGSELYELSLNPIYPGRFSLQATAVFFELPSCSLAGKAFIRAPQGPQVVRAHSKVVRGLDNKLKLYASAPFAEFGTVATASVLSDGMCTNQPYSETVLEATLVEDLGYLHTESFEIR